MVRLESFLSFTKASGEQFLRSLTAKQDSHWLNIEGTPSERSLNSSNKQWFGPGADENGKEWFQQWLVVKKDNRVTRQGKQRSLLHSLTSKNHWVIPYFGVTTRCVKYYIMKCISCVLTYILLPWYFLSFIYFFSCPLFPLMFKFRWKMLIKNIQSWYNVFPCFIQIAM